MRILAKTGEGQGTYLPERLRPLDQQNWLGTERLRTDSQGHIATTEATLAFGDGFNQSIFDPGSGLDNNQFAGQDYDAESSTQHAQFRQYSSTQGDVSGRDVILDVSVVSIHTPVQGATSNTCVAGSSGGGFNPRPRSGGDLRQSSTTLIG